ncbi:MAG: SDR family oxidoreductase [Hyphomonadaceae bacterium]|nr:SDR family oxidoreductase [Hyphomonadaceae bacterium]
MTAGLKRILVTGGAKRVGRRLVEQLSAAGHGLVIHANANAAEAEQLCAQLRGDNPHVWAIAADLSDHTAACALIDQASQLAGGPLSGLVNSASVFDHDTPGAMDIAAFDRAIAVNLRAPALLSERFAAQADPARDNCIVNILDQKLWNMNPDFYSYTMSKAGLLAATDMMARAFAPAVRVNAIAPGLLLPSHDQTLAEFETVASRNPMQRPIALDDVVSAVEFLMGNASLTAQVIHVDNGQRLKASARDVIFDTREAK